MPAPLSLQPHSNGTATGVKRRLQPPERSEKMGQITPATGGAGERTTPAMIKLIFMLKRHPDLTRDEFIARYESGHARLGEKHVQNAARYVRRYLEPVAELFTGVEIEPEHDVITELWFDTHDQYTAAMERLADPAVVAELVADEETLFDRSKHRLFMVDERDSVLAGAADRMPCGEMQ